MAYRVFAIGEGDASLTIFSIINLMGGNVRHGQYGGQKMIVNCLIKRVDVYRDYKLHIDFNIDFEQFCGGLDIVTIAA